MFPFRQLRKCYVLGLIFLCSLSYFLYSTGLLGLVVPSYESIEGKYIEFQRLRAPRSIKWQSEDDSLNLTDLIRCRNTQQGRMLITDEKGYTCRRPGMLSSRCCNSSDSNVTGRYSCESCSLSSHCCSVYEYCVSCCLKPDQRHILEAVLANAKGSRLKSFLSVRDHFELCLVKCRTSSMSVYQENKYKDPHRRYCYGPENSDSLVHEIR